MRENVYKKIVAEPVHGNYIWSWDSENLFYAQVQKYKNQKTSSIWALHVRSGKLSLIDKVKDETIGFLSKNGPVSIQTSSLKETQRALPWIVTEKTLLKRTRYGKYKVVFKGDTIAAFDLNKDQDTIVWGTAKGKVYRMSLFDKKPETLGLGRFPTFHPFLDLVLVSKPRMHGNQVRDSDLALFDRDGKSAFLTNTQGEKENWATWHPDGTKVLYAKSGSTKLELLDFQL